MNLTPLKVRGKRNSKATKKRKNDAPAAKDALQAPRKHRKRLIRKSLLEREIPLEIMERFLILGENTNFPLCSPLLGRLLSGRHTLMSTLVAAFGPTWEVGFGIRLIEDCWSFPGQASPTGNPEFQTSVLACQWATVGLILEAQELWARQYAKEHILGSDADPYPPLPSPGSSSRGATGTQGSPETSLRRSPPDFGPFVQRTKPSSQNRSRRPKGSPTGFPMLHGGVTTGDGRTADKFDARACFHLVLEMIEKSTVEYSEAWAVPPRVAFYLDVHPRVRIPNHLVTGPWNEEKIQRLIWLRRGGAVLHSSQTWELRHIGFRNAYFDAKSSGATGPLVAYLCLLGDFFWEFEFSEDDIRFKSKRCAWPKHMLVQMYNELADGPPSFSTNKLLNDLEAVIETK